jgi:biopolymer transport protein TolR
MLVLLVVFMVTAPMLTVGVPVDLPKTQAAKMNDQVEPLVISIDANSRVFLQETEMEFDQLIGRLLAITGSNPDAKIYVRGDKGLPYGKIMEVMGAVASAGFNRVSLIAELAVGAKNPKVLTPQEVKKPVQPITLPIKSKPTPTPTPKPVQFSPSPVKIAPTKPVVPAQRQPRVN